MKLFVTGGTGFIGSALVRLALARGHQVVNFDALTYAANPASLADLEGNKSYRFVYADLRDRTAIDQVLADTAPDAVLHLAAESHVDRSIDGPQAFVETNVTGTFNLLEAARAHWLGRGQPEGFRFLHVSTDEVFGSLPDDPAAQFREDSSYAPRSPYAASKAAADHLVRAWHETYRLPVLLTNCSNNYGPRQFPEKLIPVAILNAIAGRPIPIYGAGLQVRDWLHVDDHADALLQVLARGTPGQSYNIGSRSERRNIDLVRDLCAILDRLRPRSCGHHADLIAFVSDRPGHDARYAIDPGRIERELGWTAAIPLAQGLEQTVAWYLANEAWWRPLLERAGVGERLGLAVDARPDPAAQGA